MPGLIRGVARTAVIAGTATHVSNNVSRRQANKWAQQDTSHYQQQAPPPPAYAPAPPPVAVPVQADPEEALATLKKLGDLHAAGILTDEEFAAKKAEILAQI